jgi:DEAD/DEAH box helicase
MLRLPAHYRMLWRTWGRNLLDVFQLRQRLVDDYGSYVSSFIRIKDERVQEEVYSSLGEGLLWPDPLIQLNPSFEAGETIDELVAEGILHKECARIFRRKQGLHDSGEDLRLHRHQAEAIKTARAGHNYGLTTGTGSGKSLAYIVPVVDHVLRRGPGRGIQAIVVYPMNALANSQYGELEKFLNYGYADGKGPVTFARYTGQESDEERQKIIANPPDARHSAGIPSDGSCSAANWTLPSTIFTASSVTTQTILWTPFAYSNLGKRPPTASTVPSASYWRSTIRWLGLPKPARPTRPYSIHRQSS